jgi:hypothetical protein
MHDDQEQGSRSARRAHKTTTSSRHTWISNYCLDMFYDDKKMRYTTEPGYLFVLWRARGVVWQAELSHSLSTKRQVHKCSGCATPVNARDRIQGVRSTRRAHKMTTSTRHPTSAVNYLDMLYVDMISWRCLDTCLHWGWTWGHLLHKLSCHTQCQQKGKCKIRVPLLWMQEMKYKVHDQCARCAQGSQDHHVYQTPII